VVLAIRRSSFVVGKPSIDHDPSPFIGFEIRLRVSGRIKGLGFAGSTVGGNSVGNEDGEIGPGKGVWSADGK
jgi:hypothetical protein